MRKVTLGLLLAAVIAAGVHWGTFAAGGSDSYCYANQAERWASLLRGLLGGPPGQLQVREPLALTAPWPDAPLTFAPAGHLPSPTVRGALVPICPSGLSIFMAPLRLLGRDAIFLAVPLFGALLVGATFAVGSRYGARMGLASAVLTAASPIFLFQLMQPMSDVPAAALWMAAVAAVTATKPRSPAIAGLAAGAAILVRPNLVVLGFPIGLFLLFRPERTWRERARAAVAYAAGAAGGCVAVALIQNSFYGSPFNSGYGSLGDLFALGHVGANASREFRWMTGSHSPAWLLALLAPFLLPGALTGLLSSLVVVNVAAYLPYVVFDEWWYLRFLLPVIPIVIVLMTASVDAAWRRMRLPRAAAAAAAAAIGLTVFFLMQARERQVFELRRLESRYVTAGEFVARRLPARALILTSWESGSVRFYSRRPTLVWDQLDPAWLDRAIAYARAQGLEPYLLFERGEEPDFRRRFAGSAVAALDWPPMAEVAGRVRIYRPGDRERYLRGEPTTTEYAR